MKKYKKRNTSAQLIQERDGWKKLKSEEEFKFGLFNCAACQFSNNSTATYYSIFYEMEL